MVLKCRITVCNYSVEQSIHKTQPGTYLGCYTYIHISRWDTPYQRNFWLFILKFRNRSQNYHLDDVVARSRHFQRSLYLSPIILGNGQQSLIVEKRDDQNSLKPSNKLYSSTLKFYKKNPNDKRPWFIWSILLFRLHTLSVVAEVLNVNGFSEINNAMV